MFKKIYLKMFEKCKEDLTGIVFVFFVFTTLFYFKNKINYLIYEYLTVDKDWSNMFFDLVLVLGTSTLLFYFCKKILVNKYLYSYNQFFFLIVTLLFILLFCLVDTKWKYTKLFYGYQTTVPHISLIIIFILGFICIGIYNYTFEKDQKKTITIFKEDNSIDSDLGETDILNYTHIVKNLKEKLILQNFNKSFTVGIIGPWGNGKSSFISLLKKEFNEENDIIPVTFLPYLNHTEAEISSEFFHSFQSALTPYSGKLSNLIVEYSNKLLNLYNDKSISNFLKKDIISSNTTSANDTYEIINETLSEINKKIIVFVDDLDRLNQEEILQVLKLIRNTANFRNTVFIVAMDKGYILNRLSNDDGILNNRFIDKFFQLEIYLPEIDKSILREEFKSIINNSSIFKSEQSKIEFESIINLNKILFDDYIKNLRDVKRICNQIIFEYEFINEEIKLEDFINFILLKLNFPEFINKLKSDPNSYLEKIDNYYRLIKVPSNEDNSQDLFYIDLQKFNEAEYKKYQIYTQLFNGNEICNEETSKLSCDEKKIIIKTLAALFGDKDILTPNSIKFENNFRRFMQLNYQASDFLNRNFILIIEKTEIDEIKAEVEIIIKNEQQLELLDRLKYFTPTNDQQLQTAIIIYLSLLDTLPNNQLPEYDILRNVGVLTRIHISDNENPIFNNVKNSNWLIDEVITQEKFDVETELKLIGYLWEINKDDKLWDIETEKLSKLILLKFNDYLKKYDQNLWEVNDYTFFRIYHNIKVIGNLKDELINDFKIFLNKNKIDIFCAQCTDVDGVIGEVFKITDSVIEFFGSKENFKDFVNTHKDHNTSEILEYLKFLELSDITKFSVPIVFKFKKLNVFLSKLGYLRSQNTYFSDDDKAVQIFLKVTNEIDFNFLKKINQFDNSIYRVSDFKFYNYKREFYIVVTHYYGRDDKHILGYMEKIYNYLKTTYSSGLALGYSPSSHTIDTLKIDLNNELIINVYSIQPS